MGLVTAHIAQSCRNAHCIPLLLPGKGSASGNLILSLSQLCPALSLGYELWAVLPLWSFAPSPLHLPSLLTLAHLQMVQCVVLSLICALSRESFVKL